MLYIFGYSNIRNYIEMFVVKKNKKKKNIMRKDAAKGSVFHELGKHYFRQYFSPPTAQNQYFSSLGYKNTAWNNIFPKNLFLKKF